jgi:hypothetical protein
MRFKTHQRSDWEHPGLWTRRGLTLSPHGMKKIESGLERYPGALKALKRPLGVLRAPQNAHPLDVPRERGQRPFRRDIGQPAQREAPEAHHVLDDAEYRFDRALA